MKKALSAVFVILVLFIGVLCVRTATFTSRQVAVAPVKSIEVDRTRAVEHLSKAVQFKTISFQDPAQFLSEEFEKFRAYLVEAFPKVHSTLKREIINTHALLYTWPGTDVSLPPIILLAHYDVVPVDPGSEGKWTHPPFAGEVADGFIWGRGTLDFKCGAVGILEACEALLNTGFRPRRTVYMAFGHDEEVGGVQGAQQLVKTLQERPVRAFFLLDEGSAITDGILPGMAKPVALICVGEKGYASLELVVEGPGGHSSSPPAETNIGILARAITRLEKHQMPARLEGPVRQMLECAAPEMSLPLRLVMANLWAFKPLVKWQLSKLPAGNAALRTTTAPTIIQAGTKENVLPTHASAVVNFRILPGDTVETVLEHAKRVVNDSRVQIDLTSKHDVHNPTPLSQVEGPAYNLLATSIRQVMPEAAVAPGLTLGGTDARHYTGVAENCYRLEPLLLNLDELARIHGTDERLSVENYLRAIRIYAQVLRNACG